jgi:hypothetical protein
VDKRLQEYQKIENVNREKIRNNVDDRMEAKELEKEVFGKSQKQEKP